MQIKRILNRQKIILDAHGHYEQVSFNDPTYDFHFDKETKYKIDGKEHRVKIKIPLNSDRPIEIRNNSNHVDKIPSKLKKEIKDVLSDKIERDLFLKSIIEALQDYPKDFNDIKSLKQCVRKIGKAFGFDWDNLDVKDYFKGVRKNQYSAEFSDYDKKSYAITLNKDRAVVEDLIKEKIQI